jgi:hypothetical protein
VNVVAAALVIAGFVAALAGGAATDSRPMLRPKPSRTITDLRAFDLSPAVVCGRRGMKALVISTRFFAILPLAYGVGVSVVKEAPTQ